MATLYAWLGRLRYYGLALLLVATGVMMRMVLTRLVGPGIATYITFSPFVMLAALIGGLGPGLLATLAAAAVVNYWLLPPAGWFTIERSVDAMGLAFFCVMGILVCIVADLYRRTRDHLDELVSVRTAALRQTNEQLRQAKTFTDKLLNAPLDTVFLFEPPTGKPVRWNKRFAEVSGYSDEEIAGMKAPDDFYDEDDLKKAQECTRRTLADGQGVVELSLITKQGVHLPFEYAGTVVQDEEGKTLLLSVGRDITERQRAEEALKVKDSAIASSLNAIAMADLQGCLTYVNPAFLRLWGYENEREVLGKSVLDFWQEPQRALEVMQAIQNGRGREAELVAVRKDGAQRNLYLSASTVLNDQGAPICMMASFMDITERKRAEEALREWNATLESKVAQRTAELRYRAKQLQKLTLDMSEAEDRERKRLAEILHDDLQQIIAAAKFHLSVLSNRVRHDASLHAIALEIDHMLKEAIEKSRGLSHELSPAVLHHGDFTETLGWLANQMRTKHGLLVHVHTNGKVDLQSDAITALLYRMAQELLFNVVKHARVKEARLRVRRCGQCVCLLVSDRGRGFDPQELQETAGYGLLSIRERLELLGGRMKIKSAKGEGSTFFVVVPDSETVGAGPRACPTSPTAGNHDGKEGGHGGPPLRVLLADDHRIVRESLRLLLRDEPDFEIVGEAAQGREAVDLALRLEPDVVIMDVSMPLIDGDVATRRIKEHLPKTRVIALSTYNEPEMIERMYRAGAESYVLKTASSEELLVAIRGKESIP